MNVNLLTNSPLLPGLFTSTLRRIFSQSSASGNKLAAGIALTEQGPNTFPASTRSKRLVVCGLLFTLFLSFSSSLQAQQYAYQREISSLAQGIVRFQWPHGIAVDKDGFIYVGDAESRILKFTSSGAFVSKFGAKGSSDGQLSYPKAIALDAQGYIYVTDAFDRIQKFTSSGVFVSKFGSTGTGDGQFNQPTSIAIDKDGYIYVSEQGNDRIQKFTSTGVFVSKFGSYGQGDGQFQNPSGIAIAPDGNLYVADSQNYRIQKFSSSGVFLSKFGSETNELFISPSAITIDKNGYVYAFNSASYATGFSINKYTSSGVLVSKSNPKGSGDGEFSVSYGMAVDANNNLLLTDFSNNRVQKLTSSGTFLSKFGSTGNTTYPSLVTVDKKGYIYLLDIGKRIQKYSPAGNFISNFASNGNVNAALRAITTDKDDNIYIIDANLAAIQKFTSAGVFVSQFGSPGRGDGQLYDPNGIAVDAAGYIYVADGYNHRIQKFTSSGVFVSKFGSLGKGDGQFNFVSGIAIDKAGYIYVSDYYNKRIQKFTSAGIFVTKFGAPGSYDGQFSIPGEIAIDSIGNVFVADSGNSRIQKFTSSGNFITKFGSYGAENGQFQSVNDIALDRSGNIYVADPVNDRIQIFAPVTQEPGTSIVRINCGGETVYTATGTFDPDIYFGGATKASPLKMHSIANTVDDNLYRTDRVGNVDKGTFFYQIPVSNGTYQVRLHLAETYFTTAGKRVFSVAVEGTPKLINYDIYAQAGFANAVIKTYPVTVMDGNLTLDFSATVNRAKINAIEVLPANAARQQVGEFTELKDIALQAFPNPFSNQTTLRFTAATAGKASIEVYHLNGALVKVAFEGTLEEGETKEVSLDGASLPAGIYIVKATSPSKVSHLKLVRAN